MGSVLGLLLALAFGLLLFVLVRKGVFARREPKGWSAGPIGSDGNHSKNVAVSGSGFTCPVGRDGIHYFTKARGQSRARAFACAA